MFDEFSKFHSAFGMFYFEKLLNVPKSKHLAKNEEKLALFNPFLHDKYNFQNPKSRYFKVCQVLSSILKSSLQH